MITWSSPANSTACFTCRSKASGNPGSPGSLPAYREASTNSLSFNSSCFLWLSPADVNLAHCQLLVDLALNLLCFLHLLQLLPPPGICLMFLKCLFPELSYIHPASARCGLWHPPCRCPENAVIFPRWSSWSPSFFSFSQSCCRTVSGQCAADCYFYSDCFIYIGRDKVRLAAGSMTVGISTRAAAGG